MTRYYLTHIVYYFKRVHAYIMTTTNSRCHNICVNTFKIIDNVCFQLQMNEIAHFVAVILITVFFNFSCFAALAYRPVHL